MKTLKHIYGICAFALMVPGLISCGGKKEDATAAGGKDARDAKGGKSARGGKVVADGYVVKTGPFQSAYVAAGSLVPNEEVSLHPDVSGRVTAILFKEGVRVAKGQGLIQLYDADLRAALQKLKAQRQLAVDTKNRYAELLHIGGISKQDYESAQTTIQSTDADIAAAEAQLRKTKIVAPFAGTIGIRSVSVGAVIDPATVIASLQQTDILKMDFTLPDEYRNKVSVGQKVKFSVDGIRDTLIGSISATDPGADVQTRTVKIRAVVPNPNGRLVSGSFAHVIIPFESSPEAILLPSQAIIPTTRDKQVALMRSGKVAMTSVTTGTRTADKIEITSGLKAGDTVLVTALMQVKNGDSASVKRLIP